MALVISIIAIILSVVNLFKNYTQTKSCDELKRITFNNKQSIHLLKTKVTASTPKPKKGRPRKKIVHELGE
jgi:hypothetical protein